MLPLFLWLNAQFSLRLAAQWPCRTSLVCVSYVVPGWLSAGHRVASRGAPTGEVACNTGLSSALRHLRVLLALHSKAVESVSCLQSLSVAYGNVNTSKECSWLYQGRFWVHTASGNVPCCAVLCRAHCLRGVLVQTHAATPNVADCTVDGMSVMRGPTAADTVGACSIAATFGQHNTALTNHVGRLVAKH